VQGNPHGVLHVPRKSSVLRTGFASTSASARRRGAGLVSVRVFKRFAQKFYRRMDLYRRTYLYRSDICTAGEFLARPAVGFVAGRNGKFVARHCSCGTATAVGRLLAVRRVWEVVISKPCSSIIIQSPKNENLWGGCSCNTCCSTIIQAQTMKIYWEAAVPIHVVPPLSKPRQRRLGQLVSKRSLLVSPLV
jgi:hypothetical protein